MPSLPIKRALAQAALALMASAGVLALAVAAAAAQNVAELNQRGVEAYDAGRFEEAVQIFEQAYAAASDQPTIRQNFCNALQSQANALAQKQDFTAAIELAERAIKVAPENPSPLVQLGSYYLRLDRVSDAIFRLEEAIELKPGNLDAHELLGKAYYEDNDLPSARAQWDYVLQIDPKRPGLQELYDKAFREESVEWDFRRKESKNFKLSYPEGVDYTVRGTVLRILEKAYRDIGAQMGKVYPPEPVQVIAYGSQQFSEATQLAEHVGAVYDGKIRVPLNDASGAYLSEAELTRRLTHEYVHVVVRLVAGPNVPWWVNEGLAEQLSYSMTPADVEVLTNAYRDGTNFKIEDLDGQVLFTLTPEKLRVAYRQAHATVSHLWRKYGRTRMQLFLGDLAKGVTVETSIKQRFNKSLEQLDRDVAGEYR